jgi:hypothetical protein
MESTEEADAAIVLLNSTELMGKFMTVETVRHFHPRACTREWLMDGM